MAGGIVAMQHDGSSRRGRPSFDMSNGEGTQGIGWVAITLGTAAIVAGLGSRNKGAMALALTAFAGATAAEAMRRAQLDHGKAGSNGQVGAAVGKPAVE